MKKQKPTAIDKNQAKVLRVAGDRAEKILYQALAYNVLISAKCKKNVNEIRVGLVKDVNGIVNKSLALIYNLKNENAIKIEFGSLLEQLPVNQITEFVKKKNDDIALLVKHNDKTISTKTFYASYPFNKKAIKLKKDDVICQRLDAEKVIMQAAEGYLIQKAQGISMSKDKKIAASAWVGYIDGVLNILAIYTKASVQKKFSVTADIAGKIKTSADNIIMLYDISELDKILS